MITTVSEVRRSLMGLEQKGSQAMPNQSVDGTLVVIVAGVMTVVVLYLSFQLWLARRDADILRQVPVMRPTPAGSGCALPMFILLVIVGVIFVARLMA